MNVFNKFGEQVKSHGITIYNSFVNGRNGPELSHSKQKHKDSQANASSSSRSLSEVSSKEAQAGCSASVEKDNAAEGQGKGKKTSANSLPPTNANFVSYDKHQTAGEKNMGSKFYNGNPADRINQKPIKDDSDLSVRNQKLSRNSEPQESDFQTTSKQDHVSKHNANSLQKRSRSDAGEPSILNKLHVEFNKKTKNMFSSNSNKNSKSASDSKHKSGDDKVVCKSMCFMLPSSSNNDVAYGPPSAIDETTCRGEIDQKINEEMRDGVALQKPWIQDDTFNDDGVSFKNKFQVNVTIDPKTMKGGPSKLDQNKKISSNNNGSPCEEKYQKDMENIRDQQIDVPISQKDKEENNVASNSGQRIDVPISQKDKEENNVASNSGQRIDVPISQKDKEENNVVSNQDKKSSTNSENTFNNLQTTTHQNLDSQGSITKEMKEIEVLSMHSPNDSQTIPKQNLALNDSGVQSQKELQNEAEQIISPHKSDSTISQKTEDECSSTLNNEKLMQCKASDNLTISRQKNDNPIPRRKVSQNSDNANCNVNHEVPIDTNLSCQPTINQPEPILQTQDENKDELFLQHVIEEIGIILQPTVDLKEQIEQYLGISTDDIDYTYMDELLTRTMIKLDNLRTGYNMEARLERKIAIKSIQNMLMQLDFKLKENQNSAANILKDGTS